MMSSKELELKLSLMVVFTKVNFMVARNMAEASTSGLMEPNTVESGETIRSMVMECTTSQIYAVTRVNGIETNFIIEEFTLGLPCLISSFKVCLDAENSKNLHLLKSSFFKTIRAPKVLPLSSVST
jgi:hypothetical protein